MRNTFYITFLLSLFLFGVGTVSAQSPTRMKAPGVTQIKNEKVAETLLSRADNELTRRINMLQKLLTRIQEFKKLTDAQKASLTVQIQDQIAKLTDLQAQIKANSEPSALKLTVAEIKKNYNAFGLFMPKIQILSMADRMSNTADQFDTVFVALQAQIDQAKANNVDTTAMEESMREARRRVANAKTQALTATNLVLSLTPSGFPGNKTILINARTILMKGHQDLIIARQDVKTMTQALKTGKMDKKMIEKSVKPTKSPATP